MGDRTSRYALGLCVFLSIGACTPEVKGRVSFHKNSEQNINVVYETCGSSVKVAHLSDSEGGNDIERSGKELAQINEDVIKVLNRRGRNKDSTISITAGLEDGSIMMSGELSRNQLAKIPNGWYAVPWHEGAKGRDLGSIVAMAELTPIKCGG